MATFIEMPKLSDTMTEGTLLKWHIQEGDEVSSGDVIADVETDKATMELEAFDDGRVGKIYIPEGGKAPLGAVLLALVEEGEDAPDQAPSGSSDSGGAGDEESSEPESKGQGRSARGGSGRTASGTAAGGQAPPPLAPGERVKASPLAKRIAQERGVDLRTLRGTGPGGRIVRRDVEEAPAGGAAAPSGGGGGAMPQAVRPSMDFDPGAKRVPLSGMRTIIAERLLTSKTTIPHFYLQIDLNAEPLMKMRKQVNESAETSGNKFTVNDFVLKAAVMAMVDVPEVNAAWDPEGIVQYEAVNLAVAIAVPDGLVTPVIREAQNKTMLEISKAVKDFAERAKNKKLSPDEFAGGTITISNLGAYGIERFDAIINPPQSAILSIGTIRKVPVVSESGELVPGMLMGVGMSCDHRVIDGAVGATYLQALRKYLENPALMLV